MRVGRREEVGWWEGDRAVLNERKKVGRGLVEREG